MDEEALLEERVMIRKDQHDRLLSLKLQGASSLVEVQQARLAVIKAELKLLRFRKARQGIPATDD